MIQQRIKVIGRLPNEKETTLAVLDINQYTPKKCEKIVDEYAAVFPNIEIKARKGNFKKPISKKQLKAIDSVIMTLQSPLTKVLTMVASKN